MRTLSTLILLLVTSVSAWGQNSQTEDKIADSLKTVCLDEVFVSQKLVQHTHRKDTYSITQDIISKAFNIVDLLKRIPTVSFNNLSQKLSVKMDDRVVLLVNNIQLPLENLQSVPFEKVVKIEILHVVPERYKTEGYRYAINIVIKKELGQHLSVENFCMISPRDNGDNVIANEQPKINYLSSKPKWSWNIGYGFATIHWNYPLSYIRDYDGLHVLTDNQSTTHNPNYFNNHLSHNIDVGADYQVSASQLFYFRSYYSHKDESVLSHFLFREKEQATSMQSENYDYHNKNHNLRSLIGHQWTISDRLKTNFTVNFDFMQECIGSLSIQEATNDSWISSDLFSSRPSASSVPFWLNAKRSIETRFKNWKTYLKEDFSVDYQLNDLLSLNGGYSFSWNKYGSGENYSEMLSKIFFRLHHVYLYTDFKMKERFGGYVGCAIDHASISSCTSSNRFTKCLPFLQLYYMPHKNVQLECNFQSNIQYPKLYQLAETAYTIDQGVWMKGQTNLNAERVNILSMQATLWDCLVIGGSYEHVRNHITDSYVKQENTVYQTFVNALSSTTELFGMYEWNISKHLSFCNSIRVNFDKISYGHLSNRHTNLLFESKLNWMSEKWKMKAELEYSKGLVRNPLLHGYDESGQDLWQATIQKSFFHKKLIISLSYVPPIRCFVSKYQEKTVRTPSYKLVQKLNLHTYDNLFLLRITLNLHSGKNNQLRNVKHDFIDEGTKGRDLL